MGFNARLFEVVLFPESYNLSDLRENLGSPGIRDYAFILHDMDEGKAHWHVMLRTKDTRNSDYVAKWFGVGANQVEKVKGRFADALRYLTHANAPDKHQYPSDAVESNYDWKKEAETKSKREKEEEIYSKIISGEIKEYNYHQYIEGLFYIRNKRKIEDAFRYRKQTLSQRGRNMRAIYITGDSGVGKTSYAKMIASNKGLEHFISSGSNDILDGYQGQPCLILDDLRPSSLGLSDLLKLLDPYTASSVKSRYSNKVLECELVIITTTLPIDEFFKNVFESEQETAVQLKRRCQLHVELTRDFMFVSMWNKELKAYGASSKLPNVVPGVRGRRPYTDKEEIEFLESIVGMDSLVDELKRKEEDPGE